MDFEPNDDQRAILEAVDTLLAQHAGPDRALELAAKGDYDFALEAALREAGFAGIALEEPPGFLEAALIVERVARAAGISAAGASMLVAAGTAGRPLPEPVALAPLAADAPIRFAAHARSLLVADGDEARWITLEPGDATVVESSFGYPIGRVPRAAQLAGESLGPGSGERMRSWWRVALAIEACGTMAAALSTTVTYVGQRRQFGRAIGSFQAVQHRLAQCAVLVEGARWLALEAAWRGAPAEASASAAAHAIAAAGQVFRETHQLSGAIGFTREHPLHIWSLRLQALRLELGGAAEHRRALARARWSPGG